MRVKMSIVIMVIFMTCQLLGEIKAAGEIYIPTAEGKTKTYRGVITITQTEILILCQEKIFQLFNEFTTPKLSIIKINSEEVERVSFQGNGVIIFPKERLFNRHRNLINRVSVGIIDRSESWAFIFVIDWDIYKNIGEDKFNLLEARINKGKDPYCNLCKSVYLYSP